jgi:hypothetical protein
LKILAPRFDVELQDFERQNVEKNYWKCRKKSPKMSEKITEKCRKKSPKMSEKITEKCRILFTPLDRPLKPGFRARFFKKIEFRRSSKFEPMSSWVLT